MDEELIEIYRGGGGHFQAEMIRSLLAGSGIEAISVGDQWHATYPSNVGAIGEFRILVRAPDAEAATELLDEILAEEAEPVPEGGEELPPT